MNVSVYCRDEWPSTEKDWRSLLDKMETSCNEKIQLLVGGVLVCVLTQLYVCTELLPNSNLVVG